MDTEFITIDILQSNQKHDREHGNPFEYQMTRTRSAWNTSKMAVRKKLTDKQIDKYAASGHYSQELKDARKQIAASRKRKRDGNFNLEDGRLIYVP